MEEIKYVEMYVLFVETAVHTVLYVYTQILKCICSTTPLIRIANYPDRLGPSGKFVDIPKTPVLPCNYRYSDQVQYNVMTSRTSNQAWSKGLDADTYCKQ